MHMTSSKIPSHSYTKLLAIATWWGLIAGLGEGLAWYRLQSPVWHDLIRAALIVNGLLFLMGGLALAALNHRPWVSSNILLLS